MVADYINNRVREVKVNTDPTTVLTAGDVYTVSGTGVAAAGPDATQATSSQLDDPGAVAVDPQGDYYIADTANNRVQEVAATTHTQWGVAMTAGDTYTVAGSANGSHGSSGDNGAAASAFLNHPEGVAVDSSGDLYIADTANNRVQEVAASSHTQWGISMTAGDIYTVAGSATGSSGYSGDNGLATSALLNSPQGVALDSSGDLYIADTGNNRVQEVPASAVSLSFGYTGATQTWTVPSGVTSVSLADVGGGGGDYSGGGLGASVEATVPVTAGQTLTLYVGAMGFSWAAPRTTRQQVLGVTMPGG